MVDLIWKLCNIAFESGVVPEDLRSAVTVPLYKGKVEIAECGNYKGLSFLSVVGKIYAENLVEKIRRVTGGLMMSMGASDWIFTLK